MMQGSNRSGLQCLQHPNEQITNYCLHVDCLRPLCPDCVQLHTKYHQKQQIQSWKHCINKSSRNVKITLDQLRSIYDKNNQYQHIKSIDIIQSQNVKKLNQIKDRLIKLIDDVFNIHQQRLRNVIRTQYKIQPPDTGNLKMAIDQLQKILMKFGHHSTVLSALKKSLLLDHQSLRNYFNNIDYRSKKNQLIQWYIIQNQDPLSLRTYIEDLIRINSNQYQKQSLPRSPQQFNSPYQQFRTPHELINSNSKKILNLIDGSAITITHPNYFNQNNPNKNLHFFIPKSKQLKLIDIQKAQTYNNYKTITFHSKQLVPCFFKSIITPSGQIYLTGGSEDDKRYRDIFRYNYHNQSLQFVCKMNSDRSSHSICYLNHCIYLIGGFSKNGDTSHECQVFKISSQSCQSIASLNAPSANSCAVAFRQNFVLKFGGILNKSQGNNLIQMYNVKANRWSVVNIDYTRNSARIQFLSFSAAVQVNLQQILIFGGYDNSQYERPQKICFCLNIDVNNCIAQVKNYNKPLQYAEGFWNNNPIIHNGKVYALQNITYQQDQLSAVADERRLIIFNGQRWL